MHSFKFYYSKLGNYPFFPDLKLSGKYAKVLIHFFKGQVLSF